MVVPEVRSRYLAGQRKGSQGYSSRFDIKNLSVNSSLIKSGRARPSFKAILRLSSLSALRLSLLATVLGEGGVLPLPFVDLEEREDVKGVLAEGGVGARSGGKGVREVGLGAASRGSFEIADWRAAFTLLVEGDRTFIVFLGSGVLGSGFGRSLVGVMGVNQSAYS